MIYILIISIISVGIVYNLAQYTKLIYKIHMSYTYYMSVILLTLLLIFISYYILEHSIYNYLTSVVIILYTISGIIVKGFNRKGIYTTGSITFLAKFVKWKDVKSMVIEYNKEGFVDLYIANEKTAFRQRYLENYDKIILKIKKELKL